MPTAKVQDLVFSEWWNTRVVFVPGAFTTRAEFMRDFARTFPGPRIGVQGFAREMRARGRDIRKVDGVWGWHGVALKGGVARAAAAPLAEAAYLTGPVSDEIVQALRNDSGGRRLERGHFATPARADDPPPVPVSVEDDGRYSLSPLVGGPATIGIIMVTPSDDAERSAQVARELYAARRRQVERGYTHADDDALAPGELASLAAGLSFAASVPDSARGWLQARRPGEGRSPMGGYHWLGIFQSLWVRSVEDFKLVGVRELLVKAGGLIIAAIESHDRRQARKLKGEG